ncbi:MAG: hypothetical protein K5707_03690, partial [Clostridia bacterium]|nr:hypothetical protein [Clostridia bacterium]
EAAEQNTVSEVPAATDEKEGTEEQAEVGTAPEEDGTGAENETESAEEQAELPSDAMGGAGEAAADSETGLTGEEEAVSAETAEEDEAVSGDENAEDSAAAEFAEEAAEQAPAGAAQLASGLDRAINMVVPVKSGLTVSDAETEESFEELSDDVETVPAAAGDADQAEPEFDAVATEAASFAVVGLTRGDGDDKEEGSGISTLEALIQSTIRDKFKGGVLKGKLEVILEKNNTYEKGSNGNDIVINIGNRDVEDDFELELSAEDAGTDGRSGEGFTVIGDNIVIKGVKVTMNSIMMAPEAKITVQKETISGSNKGRDGALVFNGVDALINTLNVDARAGAQVEINLGDKNDVINVTAESGAESVTVNAGDGTNNITAVISGGDFHLTSGDGNDNVDLSLIASGESPTIGDLNVSTGGGLDTVYVMDNARVDENRDITYTESVWNEEKQEAEEVEKTRKAAPVIQTGSGDDTLIIDVRSNAGNLNVDTGSGGDTVTVWKGDVDTGEDFDRVKHYEPYETVTANSTAVVTLQNSDPGAMDRITIFADASRSIREVAIRGGKGASVHLKGDLGTHYPENDGGPISRISDGIRLHTDFNQTGQDYTLDITMQQPEENPAEGDVQPRYILTDTLKNKNKVELKPAYDESTKTYTYSGELKDFTDYVLDKKIINKLDQITIINTGNTRPLLSNLILDKGNSNLINDDENNLHVHSVDARDLNVVLKGRIITVDGEIKARNIRAEATAKPHGFPFNALFDGSTNIIDMLVNIYEKAQVTIKDSAKLESEEDTVLYAKVRQSGNMLTVTGLPVNLKIADTGVSIDGSMKAGGSVVADSILFSNTNVRTTKIASSGPDYEMVPNRNGDFASVILQFSNSEISVSDAARIIAGEDILLRAENDITLYADADGKKGFTFAAALINSTVNNEVEGTLEAGNRVVISAKGTVNEEAISQRSAGKAAREKDNYLGFSIVNQKVDAVIRGARIKAGGDVMLNSVAKANVKTVADADAEKKKVSSPTAGTFKPGKIVVNVIKLLAVPIGNFFGWVGEKYKTSKNPNWKQEQFEELLNKVTASEYEVKAIKLDEESAEHGSTSVSVKVGKAQNGKKSYTYATVDTQPDAGYEVGAVYYRYLGSSTNKLGVETLNDAYTYVRVEPNDEGKYIFKLEHPNTLYEVIVDYVKPGEEQEAAQQDPASSKVPLRRKLMNALKKIASVFSAKEEKINLDDLDDGFNLGGLLDEGNENLKNDPAAEEKDPAKEFVIIDKKEDVPEDKSHKLKLNNPSINNPLSENVPNRLLTWQVNAEGKSLDTVYEGQSIRFIGNCKKGQELKKLTIKYYYYNENHSKTDTEATIEADGEGRFIFEVPETLIPGTEIDVKAEFGDIDNKKAPNHLDETGAITLAYVSNKGEAKIESRLKTITSEPKTKTYTVGGINMELEYFDEVTESVIAPVIIAGGKLTLVGTAGTVSTNLADARKVAKPDSENADDDEEEKKNYAQGTTGHWDNLYTQYAIRATSTLQGKDEGLIATNKKDEGATGAFHPIFKINPDQAYDRDKSVILVSYYTKANLKAPSWPIDISYGGKLLTTEISLDDDSVTIADDGTITYKPNFASFGLEDGKLDGAFKEGTTVDVEFVFRDAEGEVLTSGTGESKYAVTNPVVTQYNYLIDEDKTEPLSFTNESDGMGVLEAGGISIGSVTYKSYEDGVYKYVIAPAKGYKVDCKSENFTIDHKSNTDKLYASWKGLSGTEYRVALVCDSLDYDKAEVWTLDLKDENIAPPAGAVITINAVFEEDARKIKVDNPEDKSKNHGNIKINKEAGKTGDTIVVKAEEKDGWAITGIKLSTLNGESDFRDDPSFGDKETTKIINFNGEKKIKFKVPEYVDSIAITDYLKIEPIYAERNVLVRTEDNIQLSDKNSKLFSGETIKVTPSAEEIKKGMKIDQIAVVGGEVKGKDSFTITAGNNEEIRVSATLKQKDYQVGSFTDNEKDLGSIEPVSGYADAGDIVLLNIKPKEGYRAKDGTVTVTITTDKGVKKIKAYWNALNQYAFKLVKPSGEEIRKIEVEGKFEKGEDGLNKSAGVAASVNWVTGSSKVEIDSGFISAEQGIQLSSVSNGNKASSEAYAGYNSAKNAGAGALSIQVASFTSDAVIRKNDGKYLEKAKDELEDDEKTAEAVRKILGEAVTTRLDTSMAPESVLHIGSGALTVKAMNSGSFTTVGDAANKKKQSAEGMGVGAGVVFSISKLETIAETRNGLRFADQDLSLRGLDGETFYEYVNTPSEITGINISATQRMSDKAQAAAGAAGGSAFVPVAVIDILNSETRAQMGMLDLSDENREEAARLSPILDKTGFTDDELDLYRANELNQVGLAIALSSHKPADDQRKLIDNGTITDVELAAVISGIKLSKDETSKLRKGKMSAADQAAILNKTGWTAEAISALRNGTLPESELLSRLGTGLTSQELGQLKAGRTTQALKEALRAEKPTDAQKELIYNGTLKMTGPVTVKASSESAMAEYNHELTADASAQGGQTAMGGAFIISWMDNEVRAKLNQSIDTDGDITINSGASDALSATATASASGGHKGKDGSSDKQANHLLSGGANMAGEYGGMDRGKILSDGKNRQQLESPENSVAGAGAVVLNMQFVKSRAEIPDRINIDTDGKVEVRSVNRTVANIKANASTTKSNTGVGIGAALNIVKMENIARIGNGSIRASELQIKAEVADGPEMNRTQSVAQEATGFTDQLSQTIKQFIIDNLGETTYKWLGGDDDQEGPIVAFIQTFLAELIKELNLEKVFAAASGSASIEGFKAVGDLLLERLKAFPEKLAAPVITTYKEILGTFGDWDKDKAEALWDDVVGIFVTQAIGNLADSVRTNFVQTAMTDIMNGALEMVGNWMNGKGLDGTKIKEKLLTSVTNLLKESINKTVDSVFLYMSEQLPLLSKNNMRLVLEIKENKDKILKEMKSGVGNILKNDIAPYVLEVFKNEVYDYEPIAIKIKESGIKDFFIKELKTLVAKSTAAMSNQAINMLVSKLNVKLPVESSGDRHVFTTKAISGAGTTGSGGAGSLALAVILLTTKAEIAGGRNPVTVTGDVTLNAEETRRIRTHSSAAIDARGEPDNNSGDEQEEESGTTTKTFYGPDKKFTVKTTLGGIVTFEGDGTDTTVYLKPDKGYRIADDSVTRSYHEKNQEPADDQLDVARFNDEIMIVPYQDIKGKGGDIEDLIVNVKFEEDLHKVPVPEVTDPDFQVGVSVEGREPKNNEIEAKYGDFVYVIVPVTDWHENIRVQYTEGNENREISLTANPKEFSVVSQNSKETVYTFRMPDGDITKINVSKDHEKTEAEKKADEKKAKTESKDAAGRSIGVGGAFSITYGNSDVKAQIGTRKQVLTNEDGSVTEIDEENRQLDGEVNEEGDGSNLEKVYAETGREGFSAGTLTITASSRHEEENFATGGTDPFAGTDTKNASPKDKSYDFSVSLNILDNDIFAGVAKGTKVTVTGAAGGKEEVPTGTEEGGEEKEEELGEDEPEEIEAKKGDIVISATEVSANETRANAFATGKNSGVGASVAVNVSLSDITATLGSGATAPGDITVRGHSLNKDQTWSMATSVGADVQRTLNKFADGVDKTKEKLNDLTSGKIFDNWVNNREANKDSNKTNKRITGRLNAQGDANGSKAGSSLATSINVLRSQNILVDNGEDANQAANNADDDDDDDDDDFWGQLGRELGEDREVVGEQNAQGQENKNKKQKLQLAATVGFTVGFHKVRVDVGDDLTSLEGKIDLIARNANNFRTRATAAAMSLEKAENGGNDIAAAVGVSINKNKALISMEGNLEAAKDVTLDSNLTQNLTDGYKGYLAVQSVSGAISGKGYDYSIAGALSFMISLAESKAVVKGAEKISGENVTINAYDKSKLGIRAGAINFSTGAAKGGGVSIGTIWSGNTVRAEVNDGAAIRADAFKMNAEKAKVSWSDFKFPFDLKQVLSDSSELTDEQRENVQTGLIDVHREPGQKTYTVDFNISSYALMNFLDNINVLSSQNYYVETVAGSLIKGRAKDNEPNALNATGSISLVRTKNIVDAILGKNVTIRNRDWTDEDEAELADGQEKALANNSVSVTASGDTNGRLIAGAISAGSAKNSAGISLTFQIDSDEVNLKAGDGLSVRAGGDVKFNASGDTRIQTINAAAAASTEEEAKYTAGGGLNVLALKNIAKTSIGDDAEITSGALDIGARSELELLLISVSLAGAKTGVAAGGTVNGIRDRAKSQVEIGKNQNFRAETGDMNIHAKTVDKMMIFSASASAATKTDDNEAKAGAGNLSVLDSKTVGTVRLGESQMGLVAEKGSIAVTGDADTRAVNATLAAAGAKKMAIGLNANLNFFRRTSGVEIEGGEGYVIRAGKNVMTSAYGNDTSIIAAMAVSASKESAGSGNLPISVSRNNIYNKIGTAQITAGGEAAFASRLKDMSLGISGNVAVQVDLEETGEGNAAGAGAVFVFKKNTVETNLGSSSVTANGNSGELYQAMLKDKRIIKNMVKGSDGKEKEQALTGILVHSASDDFVVGVAAGVVVSTGKNGVNANLLVNSNKNNITADAGNAALDATNGGISVRANGDSLQWAVAGGLNVSHGNSAGAALAVLTSSKNVKALGHILHARDDIEVIADNVDKVRELTVNVGAATSSEGKVTLDLGISLQILKSKVNAAVASDVKSTEGSFTLKAKNNGSMDNINVALAASRSKFTTTPVFALTYYGGETNALLGSGTVDVKKAVSILADSRKDIDQVTIGASAGTGAALSGAISLMFLKDHTNALVQHGTTINGGSLDVIADSNYDLTGASVALAGSFSGESKPGGSVNGMLTLAKSSTLAEMEGSANVSGPARIKAVADRDIVEAGLAGGFSMNGVAAGVTVMFLVAGDRMDQDAANMLTYGSAKKENEKVLDTDALIAKLKSLGVNTSDLEEHTVTPDPRDPDQTYTVSGITDDLTGNGKSSNNVQTSDGQSFDAVGGYTDYSSEGGDKDNDEQENRDMDESDDVFMARGVGTTVYQNDPKDSVVARVAADASIEAGDVSVMASQDTKADLFGAAAGVSVKGMGGLGVSFGLALLRSNVIAASLGEIDARNGEVVISAVSTAGNVKGAKGSDEEARTKALNEQMPNTGNILTRSIRAVGLAVGVGASAEGSGIAV